jgi:hypothetical protein
MIFWRLRRAKFTQQNRKHRRSNARESVLRSHAWVPQARRSGARRLTADFLTARDRAANTFEDVLSLDAPRTDAPTVLVRPGDPNPTQPAYVETGITVNGVHNAKDADLVSTVAPTDFQKDIVRLSNELDKTYAASQARTSGNQ